MSVELRMAGNVPDRVGKLSARPAIDNRGTRKLRPVDINHAGVGRAEFVHVCQRVGVNLLSQREAVAAGGILGSLLVGVFAQTSVNELAPNGLLFGGGMGLLVNQAIAVVVALVFSFVVSFIILKLLDATMGLRVSATDEQRGLDLVLHEEQSYVLE